MTSASGPTADAAAVCRALDTDLGWALGVVFRSYCKAFATVVDDLPGGHRGYQVLAAAVGDLPNTQLALAQQLGVDRTVMTYLLDDLERAELVARRPDPNDRRARRVTATDRGRALLAELDERLRRAEEQVLSALSGDDRATFRTLLQRVATRAESLEPRAGAYDAPAR
ncbi:DNA-binding transcriptional regulator, MarR family [Micromonospora pattaloongensis]|uniref:DNA-binding transcriptional regulator, MarR family n=1 Tax=Micromonospora pattaloongensis TaxID=405436 RepID=A0A1H3N0N5_9ACTN|nr:MarR family transcriptional regulator [Micromonospora pattaloongensis]SDY82368.1 DNA-binding transcriptional regulator, MarR family [Micromonospora pattaloongensis]